MKTYRFSHSSDHTDIERHIYPFSQPDGLISLQEYLLATTGNRKFCVLRWRKDMTPRITQIECTLSEFDRDGVCIETKKVIYSEADIPSAKFQTVFTPPVGIPVHRACTEIMVETEKVLCGSYVYAVKEGAVVSDYIFPDSHASAVADVPLTARERRTVRALMHKSVTSKRVFHSRFISLGAILAVLLLLLTAVRPYIEALLG